MEHVSACLKRMFTGFWTRVSTVYWRSMCTFYIFRTSATWALSTCNVYLSIVKYMGIFQTPATFAVCHVHVFGFSLPGKSVKLHPFAKWCHKLTLKRTSLDFQMEKMIWTQYREDRLQSGSLVKWARVFLCIFLCLIWKCCKSIFSSSNEFIVCKVFPSR